MLDDAPLGQGRGGGPPPPSSTSAKTLPKAAPKAQAQAVPGVYIVHAAPFFSVPLDGDAHPPHPPHTPHPHPVRPAAPDYKWSARMSPVTAGSRRPSVSPSSVSVNGAVDGLINPHAAAEAYARAFVQNEVGAAATARLRSTRTSLADGGLLPGGPGPPALQNGGQHHNQQEKDLLKNIAQTLSPMLWIFALYGMIPVRIRPARVSVHPLRSTLLYVLLVQSLITVSVHHVITSYSSLLHSEADSARGVDERLLAVLSVVHVSSHIAVLIIWLELPFARRCLVHLVDFAKQFGHMVGDKPLGWWTRFMPRYATFFCIVLAPAMVLVWCLYILKKPVFSHGPSHLFQVINVFGVLVLFATACMVVRDLAADVAAKLKEELHSGRMTASRLEEFRLAWINLRQLTTDLGSMPLTGLFMLLYLLVMVTLCTYQTAVSYYNNYVLLCFASACILVLSQFALIHICDTAHRLSNVMTTGFYEPLESRSWRGLSADLFAEHQQFLHTISTNPAEVTFGGMITIKRPTYLSIMAAIATYLIVLFQLRMSDEDLPASKATINSTSDSNSLDSVFSSGKP